MEITKKDIDSLNAVVTVAVKAEDYLDKVQKILNNYRKTANIPGFRKGHVPMGMVKKQYGKAVLVEEVNKILQDALHNYLTEEKLDVLGNPLPKNDTEIDWDSKDFTFDFELGLSPKFDVDVVGKKAITHYNIEADDKMVNDQVTSIRKQYGKLISKKEVEKGDEITGTTQFQFTISPPWYRTFFAYLCYFILWIITILTVIKLFFNQKKKLGEEKKKELEIKEKLHHTEKLEIELKNKSIQEFDERIKKVNWHMAYKQRPFDKSCEALFSWSPIADQLKDLDKEIVINSMDVQWQNIMVDFVKLLKPLDANVR